jgi:ferredoxin
MREEANLKAASLLRKAMGDGTASRDLGMQEAEIEVGNEVLICGDRESCLSFASLLPPRLQPYVLMEEGFSEETTNKFLQGNEFVVDSGKVLSIQGHLGDYQVAIAYTNPIDLIKCVKCRRCLDACPERAIDAFYQMNREVCGPCQTCVDACEDVGAIDLGRKTVQERVFDQVVVLGPSLSIDSKVPPRGLHWVKEPQQSDLKSLASVLASRVGLYRKRKQIHYRLSTCGWGGFKKEGCMLCREACPVAALKGTEKGIDWDPIRCMGCGSCVSRCPNDSLTFQRQPAKEIHQAIHALLSPLPGASNNGGQQSESCLLLGCERCGARKLRALGEKGIPYPASIRPLFLPSTARISEDHILEALRLGATGVAILRCDCIPVVPESLQEAIDQSREVLDAFGADGERIRLLEETEPEKLAQQLTSFAEGLTPLPWAPQQNPLAVNEKREAMKTALRHFMEATGREPGTIPAGAHTSFATVRLDQEKCTLCMACVTACRPKALRAGGESPELRCVSWDCIACGLCESLCPEDAITLERELPLNLRAFEEEVLMQDEAVACSRCGKAFISKTALQKIQAALVESPHFGGNRQRLLELCEDCRVVYLFENNLEDVR